MKNLINKKNGYSCGMSLIVLLLLNSCASQHATPQRMLSRAEWINLTVREYNSVSEDDVFKAIEHIFLLADESDTTFSYAPNSLKAVRWTAPFPVHIWYHWDFFVNKSEKGIVVRVSISINGQGLGAPAGNTPHNSEDVYKLFFSRLDYLLGKTLKWYSCNDYKLANPNHTSLEALCMLADDKRPM